MRSAIARITLKIIELLGCVACFIAKVITDLEARRVFLRNQKYSREWSLVHNVTWSTAGNTFANITYGGFSLITTLMLISRCIEANSRPSLIEKIFLIVGMLCFFAMGGLVLAAFDQVPWELHDNSIILGCLSFFVALVMLYDLSDPMARHVTDMTQTDNTYTHSTSSATSVTPSTIRIPTISQANQTDPQAETSNNIDTSIKIQQHSTVAQNIIDSSNIDTNAAQNIDANESNDQIDGNNQNVTYKQLQSIQSKHIQSQYHSQLPQQTNINNKSNNNHVTSTKLDGPDVTDITRNGNYHRSDNIDFVHMQHLPKAEKPVFERVLLPEKKRPTYNKVADPLETATIIQTVHSPDGYIESHIRSMDYLDDNLNHINHEHNVQKRIIPKYGNSSERQRQSHKQQHQNRQYHDDSHNGTDINISASTANNIDRSIYAKPLQQIIYKTNRNYAYEEHSNPDVHHIENGGAMHDIGPKYTINARSDSNDLNRYKDAAPVIHDQYSYQQYQNNQKPMMVIRNYNSSITNPNPNVDNPKYRPTEQSSNYSTAAPHQLHAQRSQNHQQQRQRQHQHSDQQQHRNLNNHSSRQYGSIDANTSMHGTRSRSGQHDKCCQNDSDESVDFRKMNAAMRPGYVVSAAKMWDRRAAEKSNELNTIV